MRQSVTKGALAIQAHTHTHTHARANKLSSLLWLHSSTQGTYCALLPVVVYGDEFLVVFLLLPIRKQMSAHEARQTGLTRTQERALVRAIDQKFGHVESERGTSVFLLLLGLLLLVC